ncbi:serine/threonine-protein kinase TOUSLED-like isoform X3 [Solanum dulcamara]|uniref:serine/threonine-protein kinase TOUSLED-like isoform X3 n=1 Tax=Solanum dulcamara TaxID=45834 RepID=UPI002485894D|nr:serine/threonine-protein kinase TOUSLED-like isoform X3 [Solanum dulcamara]
MADDMVIHFASNSSNQSDQSLPTRIAKLEARMVGKASSVTSQANSWSAPAIFGAAENVAEAAAISSDSDDDDDTILKIPRVK